MEGSCARTKGRRLLDQAIVAAGACITLAGRANGHCSLSDDRTDALVESPFARRTQLSEAHGVLVQQRLKKRSLVVLFLVVRKIELVSRFGTGNGTSGMPGEWQEGLKCIWFVIWSPFPLAKASSTSSGARKRHPCQSRHAAASEPSDVH